MFPVCSHKTCFLQVKLETKLWRSLFRRSFVPFLGKQSAAFLMQLFSRLIVSRQQIVDAKLTVYEAIDHLVCIFFFFCCSPPCHGPVIFCGALGFWS